VTCDWVNKHFADNDTGILVAYNGETCDLAWRWKLTQAPRSTLSFTDQLKFFLDPKKVIEEYKRCPLHKSRSKLESYELWCVWKYIYGQNLNGAHDALEDTKAQTDIVLSKYFVDSGSTWNKWDGMWRGGKFLGGKLHLVIVEVA
jgi:hypothetical protein